MKPARRKQVIEHLQVVWQISVRHACRTLMAARSTFYYKPCRDEQAALRKRIREIAETRIRYGYRRIHVLLQREGWQVNAKRVYRLYKEEGLQLRSKTPKRKVSAKRRESPVTAAKPNEVWAMDFMSDQLFDGRRIRILTVVDAFTRVSPAVDVRRSYRGADVVDTLERVTEQYGIPKEIRVDNGPEFISKKLRKWSKKHSVELLFIQPGCPSQNAYIERFNRTYREDVLDAYLFHTLDEVRLISTQWSYEYNYDRPHQSLNNMAPMEYAAAM